MKLFYSKEAVSDLKRLREFIAEHDPDAAAETSEKLLESIDLLEPFPRLGHPVAQAPASITVRDLFFGSYVVRYLLGEDRIVILRIWHQKEDGRDDAYPFSDQPGHDPVVSEPPPGPGENPVKEKSFAFALQIVTLFRQLQDQREYVLSKQVLRSGTSIGANIEEALAAESRRDFVHKMAIAAKEARETAYWLRLIDESRLSPTIDFAPYRAQSRELIRLLSAIVKTTSESLK